jgi:hypothetical protein
MNNGGEDEWAVVFTADGAFISAFDHESAMTPHRGPDHELWPGLLEGYPGGVRSSRNLRSATRRDGFVATAVVWR